MSHYADRCDQLRALVLRDGLNPVAERHDMPSQSTLQNHVKGHCLCDAELPALRFEGVAANGEWVFDGDPPCPDCETDLLVETNGDSHCCHGCEKTFTNDDILNSTAMTATDGGVAFEDLTDSEQVTLRVVGELELAMRVDIADVVTQRSKFAEATAGNALRGLTDKALIEQVANPHQPGRVRYQLLEAGETLLSNLGDEPRPAVADGGVVASPRVEIDALGDGDSLSIRANPRGREILRDACRRRAAFADGHGHDEAANRYEDLAAFLGGDAIECSPVEALWLHDACQFVATFPLEDSGGRLEDDMRIVASQLWSVLVGTEAVSGGDARC